MIAWHRLPTPRSDTFRVILRVIAMSYDLVFAKPRAAIPHAQRERAYDALIGGNPGDLFEPLPVNPILNALAGAYEDFEPLAPFPSIRDGAGSADVFHDSHKFTFGFRADHSAMQRRIIEIFRRFGCPAYDPQISALSPLNEPSAGPAADGAENHARLMAGPKVAALNEIVNARQTQREQQKRAEHREFYAAVDEWEPRIARDCAGGLWQRLGLTAEDCARVLYNSASALHTATRNPPVDNLAVLEECSLVLLAHLGAIPPGHECVDPVRIASLGVARALEFCHGDWREGHKEFFYSNPMSRAESRAKLGWIDAYREGLMLALYVDDESAIGRLLAWPDTDLPIDEGLSDRTAGDNFAHIASAFVLRGEPRAKVEPVAEKLRASKRKRANVFFSAVEAAAAQDSTAFGKHLKELCSLFRKSPKDLAFPETFVDGTILWHLARRSKIALPKLPDGSLHLVPRARESTM